MKLSILAPKAISQSTKLLIKEANEKFTKVDLMPINDIIIMAAKRMGVFFGDVDIESYDYVLPRIDSKRARFGYHVISALDSLEVKKPYTKDSILIAHNKFSTIWELRKAGIPIADTVYTSSRLSAQKLLNKLGFPIVIKLVSSFGGKGVTFAENKESAKSIVRTLNLLGQDILLEEFIENPGEDIRIFVIGDDYVSMKRIAKKGELRANIKSGGKGIKYKPTDEQVEIAFKSAEVINSKICAVDMVEGKDGTKVIELNINPGLIGISEATGTNIAKMIIDFCYEEAKK